MQNVLIDKAEGTGCMRFENYKRYYIFIVIWVVFLQIYDYIQTVLIHCYSSAPN